MSTIHLPPLIHTINNKPSGACFTMNTDTLQALARLSKASKYARHLRSSLDKLLCLLPASHEGWHRMADETRQIEEYLEAMLAIIREVLEREPSSYADVFLAPPEQQPDVVQEGTLSHLIHPSPPMKT
jgi:hypothetical protein